MSERSTRLQIDRSDATLKVTGEIDAHSAPELQTALAEIPADTDMNVDMSAVDFIDSSGLRVLLEAHAGAEEAGRRLVVVNPSPAVKRLVEISGLDNHLNLQSP